MAGGIRSFADPDLAAEIAAFFETHEISQATLTLDQHLERLQVNVATRRRLGEGISGQLA